MTDHRLGRGFDTLRLEEQVRALRDHAIGQELVIAVLFKAIERLGVDEVAEFRRAIEAHAGRAR